MRYLLAALIATLGTPAAAGVLATVPPVALDGLAQALPDPTVAAAIFGGLGLIAGARRARIRAVAD